MKLPFLKLCAWCWVGTRKPSSLCPSHRPTTREVPEAPTTQDLRAVITLESGNQDSRPDSLTSQAFTVPPQVKTWPGRCFSPFSWENVPHSLLWEQTLGEWERSEKWPISLKPTTNPGDPEKTLEDKVPPVRFGVRGITLDSGTPSQGCILLR